MDLLHSSDNYGLDFDSFVSEYNSHDKSGDDMRLALESWSVNDDYALYGIDNDFDLIEAMYEEYERSTGNLIRMPWFIDFRINCAMNPEYTDKCLASPAFADIRDKILAMIQM